MLVNSIRPVAFKGQIIDAHGHIGTFERGGTAFSVNHLDEFLKRPLSNGDTISKIIVSNLDCMVGGGKLDEYTGNMNTLRMCQDNVEYSPLAVAMPHKGSVAQIEKLLKDNPDSFIGLKFHPDCYALKATDELYVPYLKLAEKHKLPSLFHCGINWENGELVDDARRFSDPKAVYQAAKKIPNTPVIMAHLGAGGEKVHQKAIDVLLESIKNGDAKLYADISWVDCDTAEKPTIIKVIKALKNNEKGDFLDRLLFGSDVPIAEFEKGKNGLSGLQYYDKMVNDIQNAIKKEFGDDSVLIIDRVFYKNAQELFYDRNWAKSLSEKIEETVVEKTDNTINTLKNSNFKKFIPIIVGVGLLAIAGIGLLKKISKKPQILQKPAALNISMMNINDFAAKCQNTTKS